MVLATEPLPTPASLGRLDQLRELKLQNNKLKELPPELGDCLQLEVVDVMLNDDLTMVPRKLRNDAEIILWICQKSKGQKFKIQEMEEITSEMEELAKLNDEEKVKLDDRIKALEREITTLESRVPTVGEVLAAKRSQMCSIM